jgi:hypothetical protein
MDKAGSFHIKNIGKCSIFVNSMEVPSCKGINLNSDSLIEVQIPNSFSLYSRIISPFAVSL